jgi:hypothetical protein
MDLREVRYGGINWIHLSKDRDKCVAIVNEVMKFRVPLNSGNSLTSLGTSSFSGRTLLHAVITYSS